jgi:hypothetical protein
MNANIKTLVYLPAVSYLVNLALLLALQGDRSYNMILGGISSAGLLGVYFILFVIHRFCINGSSAVSKACLFIPAFGATSYILHYLLLLLIHQDIKVFMPLGAFFTGIGMIIVGFQTLKGGEWKDWKKFTPLLVGLYPFVVMFPVLLLTGSPNVYLIMLWGLPWLLLGIALNRMLEIKKVAE